MTEDYARKLVTNYMHGWENNDVTKILSPLADDCFITESHGPTYHGLDQVKRWVIEWFKPGSTVNEWTIDAFFFAQDTAFLEWVFTCTIDGKSDTFDGASVVQFKGDKIYHIHEYRMTKPAFDYFED